MFDKNSFDELGEFSGVVKNDWTKKKNEDATLGTNRTKPGYDEYADEKYMDLLHTGKLEPWKNYHDLIKCVVLSLGTHLGFRGQREIVHALWSYLKFETLPDGTRRITAAPNGGFDKTSVLKINNPIARKQHPVTEDYPSDPFHPVKLIYHYRSLCHPNQVRLICHVNTKSNSIYKYKVKGPVGAGPINSWINEIAKDAKFINHKLFTPHNNRARMATSVYSDPAIPDNVKMNQMCHGTMKSAGPYVHENRKTQQALQNALTGGLVGAAICYLTKAVLPQLKSQQLSSIIGTPTCFPEGKTMVPIEQQVLQQVPQQQLCGVSGTVALYPDGKITEPTPQQILPQVGQLHQPTHPSTLTVPHTHHQPHVGLVAGTHNTNENTTAASAQHLLQQEQQHRQQQQHHTEPKVTITGHLPLTTLVPHVQNKKQVQPFPATAMLPQGNQNTFLMYTYSDDENDGDNVIQKKSTVSKKRTHDESVQQSRYETLYKKHSATTRSLDEAHRYIEILESSMDQKTAIIQRLGQDYQQKEREFDMVVTAYHGKTAECNRVEAQRIQLEREVVQQQQQQQQQHQQRKLFQQQELETKDAQICVLQQQLRLQQQPTLYPHLQQQQNQQPLYTMMPQQQQQQRNNGNCTIM